MWTMSMMVSTKQSSNAGVAPLGIQIIYDNLQERDIANALAKELEGSSTNEPLVSSLSHTDSLKELVVFIDHASGSILLDLDEKEIEILKLVFAQAKAVLWVTFGGLGEGQNPGAGAVSGFLRTLRSENGGMNYATCDIETEDMSKLDFVQAISKVLAKVFSKSNIDSPLKDFEYAVQNGRILIPRVVEDKLANNATLKQASKHEPEEQSLGQEDSCLCLDMGHVVRLPQSIFSLFK